MKKVFLIFPLVTLLAAGCNSAKQTNTQIPYPPVEQATSSSSTQLTTPPSPINLTISYHNVKYGFTFSLPQDWEGYSVLTSSWKTYKSIPTDKITSGSVITIRSPLWTQKNPYQDIPIMVFTIQEWNDVQQGKLNMPWTGGIPEELGRNTKYVFILPPRYNFVDGVRGIPDVAEIINQHPLKPF